MKLTSWIIKDYSEAIVYKRYSENGIVIIRISEDKLADKDRYYVDIRKKATLRGFNSWKEIGSFDELFEAVFNADLVAHENGYTLDKPFRSISH